MKIIGCDCRVKSRPHAGVLKEERVDGTARIGELSARENHDTEPARPTPGASQGITDSREATALTRRCHTPHPIFEHMDLGPIIRVNPTGFPLTPGASPG